MLCFVVKQTTEALAEQVTQEHFDNGLIYPMFTNIRKISTHIAARVAAKAYELVPKSYIWPVDNDFYLQPSTSLILDADKEGLQVFGSDFMNDVLLAYNYSYDPVEAYLYFVDNGRFSMDGVLSDNPVTPSVGFSCFSHIGKKHSQPGKGKPLIISFEGAIGEFPGCSDLAYRKAVLDGADIINCPVQMTNDGVAFWQPFIQCS